jgi:LmbE family N-acetylglucosaminyl deacetylase
VLLQRLVDHIRVLKPAALFFPGVYELHPDHRACAQLAWHLLQRLGHDAPLGVSYEISTQSPANCLVDISQHMTRKQQAMKVYQSQLEQNNYMDVVLALNKLRTYTLGSEVAWAEAFYCYGKDELASGLTTWAAAQVAAMLAESK